MTLVWRQVASGAVVCALLVAICGLAYHYRYRPARAPVNQPLSFGQDRSFHYRMTRAVVENGDVPERDLMGNHPGGKEIHRLLPTGMYQLCAWYHRLVGRPRGSTLAESVMSFAALMGALVVLPVFLVSWRLTRMPAAALFAALVAAVIPAHVHRTFSLWYKYEGVGSLLIMGAVAAQVLCLQARSRPRSMLAAALYGLALVGALATWRLTLMVHGMVSLCLAAAFLADRAGPPVRVVAAAHALATVAAGLLIRHLSLNHFLQSRTAIVAILLGLLLVAAGHLPRRWRPPVATRRARTLWLVAVVVVASILAGPSLYGNFAIVARARLHEALHIGLDIDLADRLYLTSVAELLPFSLAGLLGDKGYSAAGLLVVSFVALPLLYRRQEAPLRHDAAAVYVLALFVVMTVLTLMFRRHLTLAGPLLAMLAGHSFYYPARVLGRARWRLDRTPAIASAGLLLVFAVMVGKTMRDNDWMTETMAVIAKDSLEIVTRLRDETPAGAVIVSEWWLGYQVQTYGERPTVTDGFLEDRAVREGIVELARLLYTDDEARLHDYCRRLGADYLLVSDAANAHAEVAGLRLGDYVQTGAAGGEGRITPGRVLPAGRRLVYFRMLFVPQTLRLFRLEQESGRFRLYKVL